jgi:glucoamylase
METLEAWIEREYQYAAKAMLTSISRVDLVKSRPGFGHTMRPSKGSIVASPVLGDWNPDPDYFFHWYRDSAVIVDALRLLYQAGDISSEAVEHFADFVRFSAALQTLDGRALVAAPAWRANVTEEFVKYLRHDAELAACHGDKVAAETRVNPDGTIDISSWTRPQHDGAPLRALALLRWSRATQFDSEFDAELAALIRFDLDFTLKYWREPGYDMWEEEKGLHYHTLCVSAAALHAGAQWLETQGQSEQAVIYQGAARQIHRQLDALWLPEPGYYRSRVLSSGERSTKELDISVILGAIHAQAEGEPHTVHDPRMHATLACLDALFDSRYAINRDRPAGQGPALGRYEGDKYFSGGAYYFSTLGAAELCFRAAVGSADAAAWMQRGDAYLATVHAYTPPNGELSEQFDQNTGEQTSAKHLAWSYAAFISCVHARNLSQMR